MRIIGGIYKNRRINFKNLNARPTTNFAKEGLFNVLNNEYDFKSIIALDLYSGTGNISYEFISRGAKEVTSVDCNIKCVHFIKKIKSDLEMNNLNIFLSKTEKYLIKDDKKYDVIFADPPYHYGQEKYNDFINIINEKKLLNINGVLIIEHSKFINFEKHEHFINKRKYGSVNFSFLKNDK